MEISIGAKASNAPPSTSSTLPLGGPVLHPPGASQLNAFYTSEDPVDLPDERHYYCRSTTGFYALLPKQLLPAAYLLGLPAKEEQSQCATTPAADTGLKDEEMTLLRQ